MHSFYVFKRKGRKYEYVQFVDPITKKLMTARSTGKKNHEEAIQQALEWLYSGNLTRKKETQVDRLEKLIQSKQITPKEMESLCNAINLYYKNVIIQSPTTNKNSTKSNADALVITKQSHALTEYMRQFWDYDKSEYVQEKLNHGQRIGRRYCYDMTKIVKYWDEFFDSSYTLEELTTLTLKEFEKYLCARVSTKINKRTHEETKHTLSNITKGNIIKCGHICFKWAIGRKILETNPCDGLLAYSARSKKRDILTADETRKIFKDAEWKDERAKIGSLLAFTCGLRMGEILALQVEDIGEDRLFISHSWSTLDKLKCTKNGKDRIVPLPNFVRTSLLHLAMMNPHKESGNSFIFWGNNPDVPVVASVLNKGFREALVSIGISAEEKVKRNIVFHSWRHSYATFISSCVDEHHAQRMLGHLTASMTEHYADHKLEQELLDVAKASNVLFDKLFA